MSLLRWALLLGAYLFHFFCIFRYAVDVPYWDEWLLIREEQLSSQISLSWLLAPFNTHFIVLTKLQFWLAYHLDELNYRNLQLFNFLIFGCVLISLLLLAKRVLPTGSTVGAGSVPLFLLFPLNFFNYENHLWAFQSCFHFFLLFHILGCSLLFGSSSSRLRLPLALLALLAALYSFAAGIAAALATASLYLLSRVLLVSVSTSGAKSEAQGLLSLPRRWARIRPVELRPLVPALGILMVIGLAVSHWYQQTSGLARVENPVATTAAQETVDTVANERLGEALAHSTRKSVQVLRFFIELVSLGFGFQTISALLSLLCLGFVVTPLLGLAAQLLTAGDSSATSGSEVDRIWVILALNLGLLAGLLSIAYGRVEMPLEWAKAYRYSEIGVFLIPSSALSWMLYLHGKVVAQRCVLTALFALAALGYSNDLQPASYAWFAEHKTAGLNCVQQSADSPTVHCFQLFDQEVGPQLRVAQQKQLSFTK